MKRITTRAADINALENILQHRFKDPLLLERAVTHRSWAHEQVAPGSEDEARSLHNEVFEFIGDSVLGLVVAEYLFKRHPSGTEGELSRMKHGLVSTPTLARASKRLSLGEFLRVGHGEEKSGGRLKQALLADVFEAVLAAIFLDGGLSAAADFVNRALAPELQNSSPENAAAADFKTLLQERLQSEHRSAPEYSVIETSGPAHRRTFQVEVKWDGGCARGQGRTIKAAETIAARQALQAVPAQKKDSNSTDNHLQRVQREGGLTAKPSVL